MRSGALHARGLGTRRWRGRPGDNSGGPDGGGAGGATTTEAEPIGHVLARARFSPGARASEAGHAALAQTGR